MMKQKGNCLIRQFERYRGDKEKSVTDRFAALGYDTNGSGMTPAEFNTFFRTNLVKWTKVTRDLNIHAD